MGRGKKQTVGDGLDARVWGRLPGFGLSGGSKTHVKPGRDFGYIRVPLGGGGGGTKKCGQFDGGGGQKTGIWAPGQRQVFLFPASPGQKGTPPFAKCPKQKKKKPPPPRFLRHRGWRGGKIPGGQPAHKKGGAPRFQRWGKKSPCVQFNFRWCGIFGVVIFRRLGWCLLIFPTIDFGGLLGPGAHGNQMNLKKNGSVFGQNKHVAFTRGVFRFGNKKKKKTLPSILYVFYVWLPLQGGPGGPQRGWGEGKWEGGFRIHFLGATGRGGVLSRPPFPRLQ